MRQECIEGEGDHPTCRLWPETDQERALKAVERAFLAATLTKLSSNDPAVVGQIERAVCTCRHLTGYGMFIELAVPGDCQRSLGVKRDSGGAVLVWRGSERMLQSIAFFEDGLLDFLEIVPVDGEPWSCDECLAITSAPIEAVEIIPQGW